MGRILYWVGILGFGILVAMDTFCNQKIVAILLAEDAAVKGEIRPNKKAIAFWAMPACFLILIVLGLSIANGNYHILLIPLLAISMMGAFQGADMSTRLAKTGDELTICRMGKQMHYHVSDIRAMTWQRHRGITGKSLVLVMHDGKSFWFHMDSFVGVHNMYEQLREHLMESGMEP